MVVDKKYEKKKKLMESEVTAEGVMQQQGQIEKLLGTIEKYEDVINKSLAGEES